MKQELSAQEIANKQTTCTINQERLLMPNWLSQSCWPRDNSDQTIKTIDS